MCCKKFTHIYKCVCVCVFVCTLIALNKYMLLKIFVSYLKMDMNCCSTLDAH